MRRASWSRSRSLPGQKIDGCGASIGTSTTCRSGCTRFTTRDVSDDRRSVVIDPRISFGRPCLTETSVPIVSLIERFEAGDRISALARDFGVARDLVEEAVGFDRRAA